jgi:hypothetical protein
MQYATIALMRGPSRLAVPLNGNDVLHAGLHVCHAKPRADTAWPHGRGLAVCAHAVHAQDALFRKKTSYAEGLTIRWRISTCYRVIRMCAVSAVVGMELRVSVLGL